MKMFKTPASTLWLFGKKGCGTVFHVDWAEASNIVWAVDAKAFIRLNFLSSVYVTPAYVNNVYTDTAMVM